MQEKLAQRMMQEEERHLFDSMHEAEHRRMETRSATPGPALTTSVIAFAIELHKHLQLHL